MCVRGHSIIYIITSGIHLSFFSLSNWFILDVSVAGLWVVPVNFDIETVFSFAINLAKFRNVDESTLIFRGYDMHIKSG